jgi:eukaryotic-like serine/threonine-protein kinase
MSKLFEELKRRKVFRVAAAYAVVAWLLIQVAGTVLPTFGAPTWVNQTLIFLFIIGFPVAILLAWAYEITPDGIRADSPNPNTGTTTPAGDRKLIYATFALVLLVAGFQIADRFLAPTHTSTVDPSILAAVPALPETRVDIVTPATDFPSDFALSPDGRQIVFVASDDRGASQLWLRSLASTAAQPLAGTEGAVDPFWSPDSRSIGFFADSALKRLDLVGGAPQTLAASTGGAGGGAWGADNSLLFGSAAIASLRRVSATGGEVTAVTTLAPGQSGHRYPYLLPDGRRFLFRVAGSADIAGIYLGHLDGSAPVRLTAAEGKGVFHPDGWLLWVRAGTLIAQRLDLAQATLTGEPLSLAEGDAQEVNLSAVSVANNGLIAYRTGTNQQSQLTWFDRTGTVLGFLGAPDSSLIAPRLSPDGRRVAVGRFVQGNGDIWLLDGSRSSRFTFDGASDVFPVWSPDGSRIVFTSSPTGTLDVYQKPSNGAGEQTLLLSSDQAKVANSWSADGRFLLYTSVSPQTGRDLWALPMTGDPVPFVVVQAPFNERWGTFSPDGRWVAYQSDESGTFEVYVRAFYAPGDNQTDSSATLSGQWQISTAGGVYPAWSPDGQELYYLDPAGNLRAAPFIAAGDTVEVGNPVTLFTPRVAGGVATPTNRSPYDVAGDGRFLISTVVGEVSTAPITLIMNWKPEAEQ